MLKFEFSSRDILSVVNNNSLYFIGFDKKGNAGIFFSLSLDQFLNDDPELELLLGRLKKKRNILLVLPDYWVGNASYQFHSKRSALAKAFIERKILSEHPNLKEIRYFFDFAFSRPDQGNREVLAFFLQDSKAFQLYHMLAKYNLHPTMISSPALIWETKLKKIIPDFNISGFCFIHLLLSECFLFFFSRGRFLFSRRIGFVGVKSQSNNNIDGLPLESSQRFNILSYEINQSLYLFSQKTKSEIEHIYLLPSDGDNSQALSEILGREVVDLNTITPKLRSLQELNGISEYLGPVGPFSTSDLSLARHYLNLTHLSLKKTLEWRPVQKVGIFIGLVLLSMIAVESFFVWEWSRINSVRTGSGKTVKSDEHKQAADDYNQAIDIVMAEIDRPSSRSVIIKIGESLPENSRATAVDIETTPSGGVLLKGIIKATGTDQLKDTLETLLLKMNHNFQMKQSLTLQDIDIETAQIKMNEENKIFPFTLKFNLP